MFAVTINVSVVCKKVFKNIEKQILFFLILLIFHPTINLCAALPLIVSDWVITRTPKATLIMAQSYYRAKYRQCSISTLPVN